MARIGILTFLHNENYGSILQAWALQTALSKQGHEAIHLDYQPSKGEKVRNLLTSGNSPALIWEGIRKRQVRSNQPGARQKAEAFRAFAKEKLHCTAPCADKTALSRAASAFDILLCGSDQVWSPVWLNPAYFLDFAGNKPRIAYAPSLGIQVAPAGAKAEKMRKLLAPFAVLSAREQEGADIIQQLTNRPVSVMPDPVCLLSKDAWQELASPYASDEPYNACYFIGSNPQYWERVKELAKRTGRKTVVIPVTEEAYHQPYEKAEGLSPEAWVGMLSGAEEVLTDSFHGTLFSAKLGTKVTVVPRDRADDPQSKNSRIINLLRLLGCEGSLTICPTPQVNAVLRSLRVSGLEFLDQAVNQAIAQATEAGEN